MRASRLLSFNKIPPANVFQSITFCFIVCFIELNMTKVCRLLLFRFCNKILCIIPCILIITWSHKSLKFLIILFCVRWQILSNTFAITKKKYCIYHRNDDSSELSTFIVASAALATDLNDWTNAHSIGMVLAPIAHVLLHTKE